MSTLRSSSLVALGTFALGMVTGLETASIGREGGPADPSSAVQAASHAPRGAVAELACGEASWPELLSSVLAPPPGTEDSSLAESTPGGGARDASGSTGPTGQSASEQVVEAIIAGMSDFELIDTVTGTELFSPEELDGMRDVRGFAERLAAIALSGVVAASSELPPRADAVTFARSVGADNAPASASEHFYSDAGRIYAVFPTDRYGRDSVLVKWQRLDRPELLVFDRYPIRAEDAYSYVWMNQPDRWDPGSYEVTMYAADETLEPIAVGGYDVADDLALADTE